MEVPAIAWLDTEDRRPHDPWVRRRLSTVWFCATPDCGAELAGWSRRAVGTLPACEVCGSTDRERAEMLVDADGTLLMAAWCDVRRRAWRSDPATRRAVPSVVRPRHPSTPLPRWYEEPPPAPLPRTPPSPPRRRIVDRPGHARARNYCRRAWASGWFIADPTPRVAGYRLDEMPAIGDVLVQWADVVFVHPDTPDGTAVLGWVVTGPGTPSRHGGWDMPVTGIVAVPGTDWGERLPGTPATGFMPQPKVPPWSPLSADDATTERILELARERGYEGSLDRMAYKLAPVRQREGTEEP